ncbi:MAG: hypothetical protein WDZ49_13345 [Litorilinea sp.]
MAVYNPEVSSTASPPPGSNDEIDLREYLQIVVNWWREIIIFTVLVTAAVAAYTYYQNANAPIMYQAGATVVVARVISNVDMDSGLRTQVDASGAAAAGGAPRRATLVALVRNGQIAEAVLAELSEMPGMENMTPSRLMRMITATSVTDNNQIGDLIEISATANTGELAAAITNAWAHYYVRHINSIYGQMPDEIFATVEEQLVRAEDDYAVAQLALEDFIGTTTVGVIRREIDEKQTTISSLRETQQIILNRVISETVGSRMNTIATYLGAQSNNRLLAFRREQLANRTLLDDLITMEIENRQLAMQTEQNMRRQLFRQYAQSELDSRLLALTAEQTEKTLIFDTLTQADANARVAVFNERHSDRLSRLMNKFDLRRGLGRLLENAQGLQDQVDQADGGDMASLSLALVLLKTQMYVTGGELPTYVQLNISELDNTDLTVEQVQADLAAMIQVLQSRIAEADAAILVETEGMFTNDDYTALAGTRPEDDALYALVQETYLDLFELGDLATLAAQADLGPISASIAQKYDELFQTGPLINASLAQGNSVSAPLPEDNPLNGDATASATEYIGYSASIQQAIENQYPYLFELGNLTAMIDTLGAETELDVVTAQQIQDLLQLEGLEDIPGYSSLTAPTQNLILELDSEIRRLQAELEHTTAQQDVLTRARNRAASAFDTLSAKLVELELQRAASSREVSVGSLAIVPDAPLPHGAGMTAVIAAGGVSFVFAIFMAFVAHLLGTRPPLSRRRYA